MLNPTFINLIGATLFFVAIIHTFSTKYFEHLAYTNPRYSGILHLLGEIEIVFGFWAMILVLFMFGIEGKESAVNYVESRNFTEPMFVFVIMVIAATRPILQFVEKIVKINYITPPREGILCMEKLRTWVSTNVHL